MKATLSQSQYQELKRLYSEYSSISDNPHFQILSDRFDELSATLDLLSRHKLRQPASERALDTTLFRKMLLKRVIAALQSANNYLSFMRHMLASLPQPDSSVLSQLFIEKTSEIFDRSHSYRLCYKLRNVFEHISGVPLRVVYESVDGKPPRLALIALRDELLDARSAEWGAIVKRDIQNGPETIQIDVALAEYYASLVELNNYVLMRRLRRFSDSIALLVQLCEANEFDRDRPTLLMVVRTAPPRPGQTEYKTMLTFEHMHQGMSQHQAEQIIAALNRSDTQVMFSHARPEFDSMSALGDVSELITAVECRDEAAIETTINRLLRDRNTAGRALFDAAEIALAAMRRVNSVLDVAPLSQLNAMVEYGKQG